MSTVLDIVTRKATDLMEYRIGAESVTTETLLRFSAISTQGCYRRVRMNHTDLFAPVCYHCEDYLESRVCNTLPP